ncbi:MAG TPA: acetate/propionate family kinase [Steroidobacteraceae bacterium]|nr:acetate/propionate family kinase [Steroidobacteraceae bacterium]
MADDDSLLVLNVGSSSLKFAVYSAATRPTRAALTCSGECSGVGHHPHFRARSAAGATLADEDLAAGAGHEVVLLRLLSLLSASGATRKVVAAVHRIVHGGTHFTAPARVTPQVIDELTRLIPMAPLHQPPALAAIASLSQTHPRMPQVACFDTAFHHTQSATATAFALPRQLSQQGVRRFGFHGISYEYIAGVLPDVMGPAAAAGRIIVAHLGSGASLCALREGRSVATTMSFTPLDGLPMGRRCGSLDPGVVLYLMQHRGMDAARISTLLNEESGLMGVSGISDDMRVLLSTQDPRAAEAIDLFVYRIGLELGALAAALHGLDALVFTGGIGEHAARIRQRVCADAAWLGIALDARANEAAAACISPPGSRASAWMIPTDEDLMMARHAWDTLQYAGAGNG